ncbi:class I mannose-6-phosphate isomerase [Paenibacillus dokdonensis]|uniref:Class I mannose-6-phosphate isomerase n=1 Tax=Paenibacillus dokdonensis TaxID=2567944 RepID=A0ABU6GP11_9BACL|nr:class I mannose-6-phosphate isomerase [Paenibacillus dokdonensis]MEC0241455.1 class I mannose-6-phosphate isomerase [Paenibacillus dokdonensis]
MFETRPLNPIRKAMLENGIEQGYEALLKRVISQAQDISSNVVTLVIDGTHGADFQALLKRLIPFAEEHGFRFAAADVYGYLKSGTELRQHFHRNITDNRAFGYVSEAKIDDYFWSGAQRIFMEYADEFVENASARTLFVIFGPGALWLCDGRCDGSLFLDVSREYQEIAHKEGLLNFGLSWNADAVEKYKIAYFVEWPLMEGYRKERLESFDVYVDMNDPRCPVLLTVRDLLAVIDDIARFPLRVKPFMMPGVWGGQYLKQIAGLPENMVNCAWNFEPIAPENSVLVSKGNQVVEIPFLLVMAYAHMDMIGARNVQLFGDYFPVRFDFLDTMDGDNLSCQVHPKQAYVRERFNEFMEQQESYYIMEKQGDAKVYLGLTEDCAPELFRAAAEQSQATGEPIPFTDYVQEWTSEKGDLYLIPTGTVHCSGKNNFVLEISATTWWFTFKIYDYVRKDLDGKPRPMNIEHAFENIDFTRKEDWVRDHLIPGPKLLNQQGSNMEYVLGEREDLLFYVNRIHLTDRWEDETDDEFVLLNLVEGECVRIVSLNDETVYVEFRYAESYIIPASFGAYAIVNLGSTPCKLIKAGVSKKWNISLVDINAR